MYLARMMMNQQLNSFGRTQSQQLRLSQTVFEDALKTSKTIQKYEKLKEEYLHSA